MSSTARKIVGTWLLIGCVMVFFQVIIGGVTRLTGSGLSITEWKPIVGAIPPLNETQWQEKFELYQQTPQYLQMNQDMNLKEFKFIFFWEYFHRFWARFMGFAFVIPFIIFISMKWIDNDLLKRLSVILVWGGLVGLYGWIMVKNGLTGLFVPPIFLSIHLFLALSLFAYLVWLTIYVYRGSKQYGSFSATLKKISLSIFVLLLFQICIGGVVSGMKAGLSYPTWPDMNGQAIPSALTQLSPTMSGILHYDPQDFWGRTFIQFLHRAVAYTLVGLIIYFFFQIKNSTSDSVFALGIKSFPFFVLLQALIGILTVLNCTGSIPVFWGVLHQAGAMLLLAITVFINFHLFSKEK